MTATESTIEASYNEAVKLVDNLTSQVIGKQNQIQQRQLELTSAEVQWNANPSSSQAANTVVAVRLALQQNQNELSSLQNQLNQAKADKEAKYEVWITWKEANMTPEELGEFQEIKQTIKERDAELEAKLKSGTFWQKYKSAIAITGGIIVLFLIGFLIYKYVKKNK